MDEPPDKVQPIRPGMPTDKPPEQAARDMRGHMARAGFKDFLDACAEYDRLRYDAYLKAGFTDVQALYLTRKDQ